MIQLTKQVLAIGLLMFTVTAFTQSNKSLTNSEIVTTFLNGFNQPEHIQKSLALLADDYKFKNPMVQLNSKAEFIALAKEIGAVITGINIKSVAQNGDWVAVLYDFNSSVTGLESNTATEWFRIENGMIKESHLIYDASDWRKFYAKMNK